jgi:hypothetical protein
MCAHDQVTGILLFSCISLTASCSRSIALCQLCVTVLGEQWSCVPYRIQTILKHPGQLETSPDHRNPADAVQLYSCTASSLRGD